jgi:DNA-binding MarR family transcriptional regulator/GNAT superfamily N-acetyltransferase
MTARRTLADEAQQLREFNRLYTREIGLLGEGLLDSKLSLTQVRLLFELGHADNAEGRITTSRLSQVLGLDLGYVSRVLSDFDNRKWLKKAANPDDRRQVFLSLSAAGQRALASLEAASQIQATDLLSKIVPSARNRLLAATNEIAQILRNDQRTAQPNITYRTHRPGDLGWMVMKHGELYAREYGWTQAFEGAVAQIAADFAAHYDPSCERFWIAERTVDDVSERVGCVALVRKSRTTAQLRVLIVDPSARGLGIGKRLTHMCEEFAREVGYKKIILWTVNGLDAAHAIYQSAGYKLVKTDPSHSYTKDAVGEMWELNLRDRAIVR